MDKNIKEKWVAALRSGEYKQANGVLRDEWGGFCCLGVLCDLADKEGLPLRVYPPEPDVDWSAVRAGDVPEPKNGSAAAWIYDENEELPPESVVEWAGLPTDNPTVDAPEDANAFIGNNGKTTLADLNDHGFSFSAIADIIEAQL